MKYWSDISVLNLSDDAEPNASWVHALPVTTFKHPIHGTIALTKDRIQRFYDSIVNKVVGTDIDIDYEHKKVDGKAAGWVKSAEVRDDGLWLLVDWTEDAAEEIKKRKWRYFSSEFVNKWKNPQTGDTHEDVFLGGGLTNRPFLKNLVPINLSELTDEESEIAMDEELRKALIKKYQLSDDATEEQIKSAISAEKPISLSEAKVEKNDDGDYVVKLDGAEGEVVVKASEPDPDPNEEDDELVKLAEEHPAIAKLIEQNQERDKSLKRVETRLRLSDLGAKLDDLPPVVRKPLIDALVRLPVELSDEITGAVLKLAEVGVPPKGQESKSKPADDTVKAGEFLEKVKLYEEENEGVSFGDAVEAVAEEHPKLYDAYVDGLEPVELTDVEA